MCTVGLITFLLSYECVSLFVIIYERHIKAQSRGFSANAYTIQHIWICNLVFFIFYFLFWSDFAGVIWNNVTFTSKSNPTQLTKRQSNELVRNKILNNFYCALTFSSVGFRLRYNWFNTFATGSINAETIYTHQNICKIEELREINGTIVVVDLVWMSIDAIKFSKIDILSVQRRWNNIYCINDWKFIPKCNIKFHFKLMHTFFSRKNHFHTVLKLNIRWEAFLRSAVETNKRTNAHR